MKGVFKKCGLFLDLSIIFGLFLNVFSNDTSALMHEYSKLPLYQYVWPNGETYDVNWSIDYSSSSYIPSNFSPLKVWSFGSQSSYDSDLGQCSYGGYSDNLLHETSLSWSIGHNFSQRDPSGYNNSGTWSGWYNCTIFGHLYNSSSTPSFDWSSLPPYVFGNPNLSSYSPYLFVYDFVYAKDSSIDTDSGLHYNSSLKSSDIFGVAPGKFSSLTIPLSFDPSVIGFLSSGRQFEIRGAFDFSDTNDFSWPSDMSSSYFKVFFNGHRSNSDPSVTDNLSFDCTVNLRSVLDLSFTQLEYSCPFTLPYDYDYFGLYITLHNDLYVWDTSSDWSWAGVSIITDNDDTPGSDASRAGHTSNPALVPGSSQHSSSPDFFSSLSDLFFFGFLNPFAPIFNLFSDNSTCASIPTLASMLHSTDTQVCPWFSSSVRNIVTPVLGLASIMLIFGFAVRWLGSSSGNFVEDSGGIDSGGYHFENKFRRRK